MSARYDGRFKILAEEYPDLLLRLLGIVEAGTKPRAIDILRELHLDPIQVDHVYLLGGDAPPRLVHFEAITSWAPKRVPLLALYRLLLMWKYKPLPISSYLVLMAEKYAPKTLPKKVVYEEDGVRIEIPYHVIRLWEIEPWIAFQPGCEPLLPWVPLLKGGEAEFEMASAAIERMFDSQEKPPYPLHVMVSNLATLATLRYDKDAVRHILERLVTKTMLSTELFVDSWLYKDGVAAGKAEGEAAGELRGKRAMVRLALQGKYPSLGSLPEIDQIALPEALDNLMLSVLNAQSVDDVHAAIQAALRVN